MFFFHPVAQTIIQCSAATVLDCVESVGRWDREEVGAGQRLRGRVGRTDGESHARKERVEEKGRYKAVLFCAHVTDLFCDLFSKCVMILIIHNSQNCEN